MPSQSLLKTSLRDLLRRRWQSALMLLGVALGVAVVIAIDLANTSARRAFSLSTEAVVGRATHQILGGPSGVPEDFYRELRITRKVRAVAPLVEGAGVALDFDQRPLRILGIDPLAEPPFRGFLGDETTLEPGFERFFTEPSSIIVSGVLAADLGLAPGQSLRLQIGDQIRELPVLGVLVPEGESGDLLPDDLLLMDISGAQELFAQVGRLSRIDLVASEAQVDDLAATLPTGLRIAPANEQAQTAAQLTAAFQLNLTALSLLALFVGVFLIYNTMMFSVVQRRRIFGIQRALGVTSRQLFQIIIFEAAAVSGLGAILGIALGWILGQGAVLLVTQTINDLYFVLEVADTPLTSGSVIKGLVLGIGAGAGAAVAPALEAARVAPSLAMQRSTLEQKTRNWLPWAAGAGAGMVLIGALLLISVTDSLLSSFAGMFLILIGLSLAVPLGAVQLVKLAQLGLDPALGAIGRIAGRTILKELSRTSVAIAALMVALSVTIGVGVMIESFRSTVVNWLDLTLRADLYISGPSLVGTRPTASLSAEIAEQMRQIPGVADVETFRAVEVDSTLGRIQLSVADGRRQRDADLYRFAIGSPETVWSAVTEGAVIVSEPFAYHNDLAPQGETLTLYSDQGPVDFPVVGVYYDYSSDRGAVLMSDNIYRRFWADEGISSIAVYLERGADLQLVQEDLRQSLAGTGLQVQANRALRQEALAIFDRTFAITAALRILAVVVAFIGVLSALMALQLERSRELATLRALGVTPRGLWGLSFVETGLMGFSAGILSVPTGFVLALVLIFVINLRSFGWTIQMAPVPAIFVQAVLVGIAAALSAGVYPVYRLGKMELADALRQD